MSQDAGRRRREEERELEMLLPWYATGTLSADEARQVEAWLAQSPEAREMLSAIQSERAAVATAAEATPALDEGALDRLMQDIDAEERLSRRQRVKVSSQRGLWRRLVESASAFSAPAVRVAAFAAVAIIVVQAVALVRLSDGPGARPSEQYRTATGDAAAVAPGTPRLLVAFQESATMGEVAALLREHRLTIVSGPTPDGIYVLAPRSSGPSAPTPEDVVAALQAATNLVRFAGKVQ